jgi:hypothetical protein
VIAAALLLAGCSTVAGLDGLKIVAKDGSVPLASEDDAGDAGDGSITSTGFQCNQARCFPGQACCWSEGTGTCTIALDGGVCNSFPELRCDDKSDCAPSQVCCAKDDGGRLLFAVCLAAPDCADFGGQWVCLEDAGCPAPSVCMPLDMISTCQ